MHSLLKEIFVNHWRLTVHHPQLLLPCHRRQTPTLPTPCLSFPTPNAKRSKRQVAAITAVSLLLRRHGPTTWREIVLAMRRTESRLVNQLQWLLTPLWLQ